MKKSMTFIMFMLSLQMILSLQTLYAAGNIEKTSNSKPNSLNKPAKNIALIITGILVDHKDKPLANQQMYLYLGKKTTTIEVNKNGSKKTGALTKIEGTGTINMKIIGIEEGGAIKLINGSVANPSSKTDEKGRFRFEVSAEFIEGEEELIITRNWNNPSKLITESLPMIDNEGNPVMLKIDKTKKILDLGKIRTLEK